jgi:LacI family sucrose operon transcriptional repressor
MNTVLSREGYQMVVVPKNTIEEDEISYLKKISSQGFDGIIVMAHAITDDHIKIVESSKTPILFTGQSHPLADSITLEDYQIGCRVAEYINTLDVNHVLYLSVSESDQSVGVLRKQGFLDTLQKPVRTLISGFRQEDAYEIMVKESSTVKYDIVVGATDNIAIGAMSYLLDHNVKIPQDVRVMGIGNYDLAHFMTPSLSTLDINYQVLGQNAASRLLTYLEPRYNPDYQPINLKLIERNSTKKPSHQ